MTAMTTIAAVIALKNAILIRFTFLELLVLRLLRDGRACACDHDLVCVGPVETGEWFLSLFPGNPFCAGYADFSLAVFDRDGLSCRRCRMKLSTVLMVPRRGVMEG
jgi:hypothetical protein